MSRILSRISMFTGQISSHALHDVHDHSSSAVMRSKRLSAVTVISRSMPTGGDTGGVPVSAITSPVLFTISRGSSGLPVACAGQTDVHRPQIVHASVSKSCFQVKSSMVDAPNVSSSVSIRFGISRIAPFGRGRSFRYMFIGLVIMCRSIVVGRITRNARNAITWSSTPTGAGRAACCACQPSKIDEKAQPTNDHFSKLAPGPAACAERRDAEPLGDEAGDADDRERREDHEVLGLGLDADAVRALRVAPHERPRDAGEEHEAEEVGGERVRLVGAAVQELQRVGQLVVDLEQHRRDEQHQEAEVDHRVHDAGRRVPEQRAHPDAAAEVAHAPVDVAAVGAAVVGLAPLVVADPQRREPGGDEQPGRHHHVERDLEPGRDVDEHLAGDRRVVVPARDLRGEARGERAEGGEHADDEHDLVWLGDHAAPVHGAQAT